MASAPDYTSYRGFPEKGAPESEILAYRDRLMNRWSIVRNAHMGRIALSFWYHMGRQWSEFDPDGAFDGVRGSILRMIKEDGGPRPVTNIISPPVEEEVIALVKRGWVPKVTPSSNDPRIKAAAQVSNDSLNYRLEQIAWPEKRHQLGFNYVVGGTGLVYTGFDESYEALKTVGSPTAVQCPACGTSLYSPDVPVDTLRAGIRGQDGATSPVQHLNTARHTSTDPEALIQPQDEQATLHYCPTCPTPTPLEPYTPTDEEAQSGADAFGRPLGVMMPKGTTVLEIDLPHEFYPQDAGVRQTPDSLRRWGRRKIRSLEWWEARAPHLVHEISPDPVAELLYDDPILGNWNTLGNWNASYDSGILDNHANADELVDFPSFRYPLGRYCLCSKDKVVVDDDLYRSATVEEVAEPVYVPRVNVSISRYKIRPTELWGTTLPEQIISPQNRINGMDRQIIDERDRLGGISLIMSPAQWISDPVETEGGYGAARIMFFQPDPSNPNDKVPQEFGGTLFPDSVYMERDRVQADAKTIVGSSEASTGNNQTGVGNTSQLQLLIEQDEKSRSLREDDLVRAVEKSWTHINEMEWILHADTPDVYRVLGPDKSWSYEQYVGNALRGQTEVKIERQAYIEKSVIKRESAREALADGLITLDSPVAKRRMLEAYGQDTDINEDTNNQVDQAERQWVDFAEKGLVRVMDSIDSPAIRYQVFGTHLLTEQGQDLTEKAGWDDISRAIAGWEDELKQLQMLEAMSIQFYGGRLIGQEAADAYTAATLKFQEAENLYAQQQKTFQQQQTAAATPAIDPTTGAPLNTPPPLAPVPPTKPPVPLDIPVLLQDRILLVWTNMLGKRGVMLDRNVPPPPPSPVPGQPPLPPPPPPPVDANLGPSPEPDPRQTYVKFRALVDAYRMSIPPVMAGVAPGSGSTSIPVDKGGPVAPTPGGPPMGPAGPSGGGQPQPPMPPATAPMPEGGPH